MKMKKILNEWKKFTLYEQEKRIDKGLLNLGQPDGLMKAFVDALSNEHYNQGGTHRRDFEQILGQDFLSYLQDKIKETTPNTELSVQKREISDELKKPNLTDKKYNELQSGLKNLNRLIKKQQKVFNKYVNAFNGLSYYLVVTANETDESGNKATQIVNDMIDKKTDMLVGQIKTNREYFKFIEDNFYSFIDKLVESAGANPASVWRGGPDFRGKPTSSKAPQVVAAGSPQDWFLANPQGAFPLFVQSLEQKLSNVQGMSLKSRDEAENEPQPEPATQPPVQNDRMSGMMSRFDDFFSK